MSVRFKNMNKQDEYYTPARIVKNIIKYIKPGSVVWCPFDTDESQFVKVLTAAGFRVVHTHIWEGKDFLKFEPDFEFDYIISNPPYSIKKEIMNILFTKYKDKKFALLLGEQALTNRGFMKTWRNYGVKQQLLLFENKVFFDAPDLGQKQNYSKPGTYFHTYYFCNGWLPGDYIIEVVE